MRACLPSFLSASFHPHLSFSISLSFLFPSPFRFKISLSSSSSLPTFFPSVSFVFLFLLLFHFISFFLPSSVHTSFPLFPSYSLCVYIYSFPSTLPILVFPSSSYSSSWQSSRSLPFLPSFLPAPLPSSPLAFNFDLLHPLLYPSNPAL